MLKPTVQVRDEGGVLAAEFWDCLRLDPAPVQELRKHFEEHVRRGGRPELVVDLNGVAFAGSAALGGFLGLLKAARAQGGRLIFCEVDPNVLEVFRISKIEPLFTFVADRPAALALASGRGQAAAPGGNGQPGQPQAGAATAPEAPPRPAAPRGDSPLKGRRRKP